MLYIRPYILTIIDWSVGFWKSWARTCCQCFRRLQQYPIRLWADRHRKDLYNEWQQSCWGTCAKMCQYDEEKTRKLINVLKLYHENELSLDLQWNCSRSFDLILKNCSIKCQIRVLCWGDVWNYHSKPRWFSQVLQKRNPVKAHETYSNEPNVIKISFYPHHHPLNQAMHRRNIGLKDFKVKFCWFSRFRKTTPDWSYRR